MSTHAGRLRDSPVDPVHGQNPDYYAATANANNASTSNKRTPPPPYANRESMDRQPRSDFRREEMHIEPYPSSNPDHNMRGRDPHRPYSRSSSSQDSGSTLSLSPSRSRSRGASREGGRRSGGNDPLSRARNLVQDNFTHTPAGIGASLLGAVVGGLVANKATAAAASRQNNQRGRRGRRSQKQQQTEDAARIFTTIAGAVAGGVGANVIANRVEDNRRQHRQQQQQQEQWWSREQGSGREMWSADKERGVWDEEGFDRARPRAFLRNGSETGSSGRRSAKGRGADEEGDEDYDFVYDDEEVRGSRRR